MDTLVAVVFGLLSISVHELGHYEAMCRFGIRVKEVALLGIPLPFLPSLYLYHKETKWSLNLFVVGAYVQPCLWEEVEGQSLRDRLYIYGNGIIANLVYALLLTGVAALVMAVDLEVVERERAMSRVLVLLPIAWLLWWSRRFLSLLLPVLTPMTLIVTALAIVNTSPTEAVVAGAGGPVAVLNSFFNPGSFAGALIQASRLSLGLAIANLLPLFPIDGGRMLTAILREFFGRRTEDYYKSVTISIFVVLIIYFLALDVIRVWNWF